MASPTEKRHNEHLDMLHDYKIGLIRQVEELQRMDRQSEFAKEWNRTVIEERRQEIRIIDRILRNLIRF